MKTIITLCLFLLSFTTMVVGQEQLLKSVKEAGKKKLQQQDFNTTRSNKEKGNLQDSKKQSAPAPAATPVPPNETDSTGTSTELKAVSGDLQDVYTFETQVTYLIESGKKKEANTVSYFYADGALMTQLQGNDQVSIMDMKNELMITLDEKNKTAFVMSSARMNQMIANQAVKEDAKNPSTITRTGNKKEILGYTCEEIIIENSDSKTITWVTTDITLDYADTFASMAKRMNKNFPSSELNDLGVMMEMFGYNGKGELQTHMLMTEFKKEEIIRTMSAYTVTKM